MHDGLDEYPDEVGIGLAKFLDKLSSVSRAELVFQRFSHHTGKPQLIENYTNAKDLLGEFYIELSTSGTDAPSCLSVINEFESRAIEITNNLFSLTLDNLFEQVESILSSEYQQKVISRGARDPIGGACRNMADLTQELDRKKTQSKSILNSNIIKDHSFARDVRSAEEICSGLDQMRSYMLEQIDKVDKRTLDESRLKLSKIAIALTVVGIVIGAVVTVLIKII